MGEGVAGRAFLASALRRITSSMAIAIHISAQMGGLTSCV